MELVHLKLEVLNDKVNKQTEIVTQELNKINDNINANVGVDDAAVYKYRVCTLMWINDSFSPGKKFSYPFFYDSDASGALRPPPHKVWAQNVQG